MKLKQLIESKKFYYVNSDITEENFPLPKDYKTPKNTEYRLFQFGRIISSEDVIREIEKEGYRPATIYDLLNWKDWNEKDLCVALGSVAKIDGFRRVAYLGRRGSGRDLYLRWFDGGWDDFCRFPAVRNLGYHSSESGTLTLEKRIKNLEKKLLKVTKIAEEIIEIISKE